MATIGELGGLSGMMGGSQDPLLGMFGGLAVQQQQQQPQWTRYTPLSELMKPSTIKFKQYERTLTFIDKLREEIDNWLKS